MIELGNVRVLLVEDNELDRRMVVHHLSSNPDVRFEVVTATTLADALERWATEDFDCVLLGLTLPDSFGLASVDAILDRSDAGPVIVLSGLDDPGVALEAVQRGAQDYLAKRTIDAELLARSIRYAITRFAGETELHTTRQLLNLMHERERIGRDLQDTVIQQLFATGMGLQALAGRTEEEATRSKLAQAVNEIDDAIHQLRETIFDLHQGTTEITVADELGHVATTLEASLGFRPTVRVVPGVDGVARELRNKLMLVVNEALTNVAKHAGASAAQVIVELKRDDLVLRVIDNGRGFDADVEPSIGRIEGQVRRSMDRRAAELGADTTIRPGPGGGSELIWRARLNDYR